uniref:Endoplasmic reticulum lectin 1 n=1 Tax=Ascaris suum TaxID=6253 RepID=F1L4R1_ASCSU
MWGQRNALLWIIASMFCVCVVNALFKGMDDSVMFRIDWRVQSAMPERFHSLKSDPFSNQPFVFISSGNDEKYLCAVPDVSSQSKRKIESYSGPSPGELIRTLYEERLCSYWLDLYWTYELCHGRYVLQYHDEKESIRSPRTEFYLGNFRHEQTKMDDRGFDQLNPPSRKVDDVDLAYYPVNYRHGTVCDLTGKPRTATVIYVCRLDAKDQIYSFVETSSCAYEVVVLTRRLCTHPSFQPVIVPQHEIVCYARGAKKESAKPIALLALERERASSFEKEYSLIPPQSLHADLPLTSSLEEEEDEDDVDTTVIVPKQSLPKDKPAANLGEGRSANNVKHAEKRTPTNSLETILNEDAEFLAGKQCLYGGGAGWWKYEFCYGKRVIQYHDDPQNGRNEILLGTFSEEIHKQWMRENPQKHPLKIDGQVLLVSYIYTGGDVCEEENIHRSVEVRIRCRPSEGSQSAVTLFLLEPHTCQYVLGVESPRFCDMLQLVDEYGLLPVPKSVWKIAD